MTHILTSRAIEQITMILSAIVLIILGFSVVGAIFGNVIGFFSSLISVIIILHKYFLDIFQGMLKLKMDFRVFAKIDF